MSLQSVLSTGFKNFGHAIAVAAKYTTTGLHDVLKVANKAQVIEPEVALLVGALAGPIGANLTNLAFHALGDLGQAVEPLSLDFDALQGTHAVNVQLDVQTIKDIKAVLPQLKAIIVALGLGIPPVIAPAVPAPVVAVPVLVAVDPI